MSSILNGVRWTEKRLTDEQLLLLEDAEKREEGCLKCEGMNEIESNGFSVSITQDYLLIHEKAERNYMKLQITYCPFCGKKL